MSLAAETAPLRCLLDVSVWIALFDDAHQFSGRANALIDSRVDFSRVHGHNQITDLYLLALAVQHGGCLVTLDQAISLSSVPGARPEHLRLL